MSKDRPQFNAVNMHNLDYQSFIAGEAIAWSKQKMQDYQDRKAPAPDPPLPEPPELQEAIRRVRKVWSREFAKYLRIRAQVAALNSQAEKIEKHCDDIRLAEQYLLRREQDFRLGRQPKNLHFCENIR